MKVKGTYFQNDPSHPIVYGDVEIENPPRRRLRGEAEKEGILAKTVIAGFCGTDYTLMKMGQEGKLAEKFPAGQKRLINGHEGVVYVPSQKRFAIVLIRGGNSYDPTRYTEEESYFEYGCDQADGLFSDENYYHPDMLLPLPEGIGADGKLPLSYAKRLIFSDPYACMTFQRERMEDLGAAHNVRVVRAREKCSMIDAFQIAAKEIFDRVVIFGLGTTGLFLGDQIRRHYPQARIVFVARSEEESEKVRLAKRWTGAEYVRNLYDTPKETARAIQEVLGGRATAFVGVSGSAVEAEVALDAGLLGNNGIYNSFSLGPRLAFDTMPFGFQNHLIFSSINFRQEHMEEAIRLLVDSPFDEMVHLIDKEEFVKDPYDAYVNRIYAKGAPLKTAVIWNPDYIQF
ncbi:MAG TPA: zinc-binding dehydrogenase [Candidatus Faecimorpha stercoravium]|nr:zinc-binding dehydrogenase [Candidatus Faecimorpha stercoravium]